MITDHRKQVFQFPPAGAAPALVIRPRGWVSPSGGDDTDRINAARVDYGTVFLDAGVFDVQGILGPDGDEERLAWSMRGHGRDLTTLSINSDTHRTIRFWGTESDEIERPFLRDVTIVEALTRTRGNAIVSFTHTIDPRIRDVAWVECANPIEIVETAAFHANHLDIRGCRGNGIHLYNTTGGVLGQLQATGIRKVGGAESTEDIGLLVESGVSGLHMTDNVYVSWHDGVRFQHRAAATGAGPEWIYWENLGIDNCAGYNLVIKALCNLEAKGTWSGLCGVTGSSEKIGIRILAEDHMDDATEPSTQNLKFFGGMNILNRNEGVVIDDNLGRAPKNITFVAPSFNANSAAASGTKAHIKLAGVDGFTLISPQFGTTHKNDTIVASACIEFTAGASAVNTGIELIGGQWGNADQYFTGAIPNDISIVGPRKNYVDNASFNHWQAGVSFTPSSSVVTFVADRWAVARGAAQYTISRAAGFSGARYCLRSQRDSGTSSVSSIRLTQQLRPAMVLEMAGKVVTLSFDFRAGANFSGTNMFARIVTGTGVEEALSASTAFPTGNVESSDLMTGTLGIPDTTERRFVCASYSVPASATEMALLVQWVPTGTAGAADYFEITNVKLELSGKGSPYVATHSEEDFNNCLADFEEIDTWTINGTRWIAFKHRKRGPPSVTPSVGSAGNITKDGFELTHNAAAACTVLVAEQL